MAKKMKKTMAMVLVLCMMVSMMSVSVFAADGTVVETETTDEFGIPTNVTTTTTTTTDENGNVTVTVTVDKTANGTDTNGVEITAQETTVENSITDANGNEIASNWVVDGSEKKEWTEEDLGDEPGQTPVEAPIVSGDTGTGTVSETVVESTEDGTITTTTTERTVTTEATEVKVTINESNTGIVSDEEAVISGPAPVYDEEDGAPVDAAGKDGVFDRNYLSSQTLDRVKIGDIIIWINDSSQKITSVHIPEGAEIPEGLPCNVGDSVASWYSGSNPSAAKLPTGATTKNNVKINDIKNWYEDGKLIVDVPEGADFMYVGTGEHSLYYTAYVTVEYEKDADGNTIFDEDGNPVIKAIKKKNGDVVTIDGVPAKELPDEVSLKPIYDSYNGSRAQNFMLMDEMGNRVYAYCCDLDTGTAKGTWYSVTNLEDSDYYASEESEEHIRSILMNGYWGTSDVPKEDGSYELGSLERIKESLRNAINNNEMEDEVIQMPKLDANGDPVVDEEGNPVMESKTMLQLIDELTEGEALLATQAAVWSYSNNSFAVKTGKDGQTIIDPDGYVWNQDPTNGSKTSNGHDLGTLNDYGSARVDFLYKWLIGLDTEEESSVVINEKNFVEDMSITVFDKDADHANNKDNNKDNDVYNTALNFRLAFVPGEKDDLLVQICYTDLDGNLVEIVRRLAGENAEGQSYEDITPEADGSYVIKGLKLSENEDFDFDLRLEGTQYLENGVYVYAPLGGRSVSQTFVGVAEGTKNVDVSVGMTIKFDVDEDNHVVAERKWHDEGDPEYPPTPFNFTPPPPAPPEIPDEEVPLADAPQTGDEVIYFAVLAVLAGFGLAAMHVNDMKRKAEEN